MKHNKSVFLGAFFAILFAIGLSWIYQLKKKNDPGSTSLALTAAENSEVQKNSKSRENSLVQIKKHKNETERMDDFLKDPEDKRAAWKLNREDGVVRVAYGGVVRNKALKKEDVDHFIEGFLENAGIEHRARVFSKENTVHGVDENILSYDQVIDDLPIYGSHIKVFVRKPDYGITYVINEFANFNEVRSLKSLLERDVEDKVISHFKGKSIKMIDCSKEVYFIKDDVAYVSRVCQVEIDRPLRDFRELVVELGEGEILKNISTLIAN